MPTFAAVDIGSNSVRLKLARLDQRRLVTLHEDREVTRLGAEVFRTGVLEPSAIARTARVLQRFHRATQSHGVTEALTRDHHFEQAGFVALLKGS